SLGSVPDPRSSIKINESLSACSIILTIFFICDEKVDRDCSIDCSSPISQNTFLNIVMIEPSKVGINKPDCAINVIKPTVFKVTVLPPVLGPVIITAFISSERIGFVAFIVVPNLALAVIKSK